MTRDWIIHERMRFLVDWIEQHDARRLKVLDASCGSGLALLYLYWYQSDKVVSYLGLDRDTCRLRSRYEFVSIPHQFENVDLDSSWQRGLFDVVFCSEVIEHMIDDRRLFSRLSSHLADGGVVLVTTPHKEFVRQKATQFPGFDLLGPFGTADTYEWAICRRSSKTWQPVMASLGSARPGSERSVTLNFEDGNQDASRATM